jgi:hypothetical protein
MSTRQNNGSHYENHQRAAELQDMAAHAHRTAAEDHAKSQEKATNEHGVPVFGHEDIATLAHQLWQARGCPMGSPEEDSFQSAKQLRAHPFP